MRVQLMLHFVTCACVPHTGQAGGIPLVIGFGVSWVLSVHCSGACRSRRCTSFALRPLFHCCGLWCGVASCHRSLCRVAYNCVWSCGVAWLCCCVVSWRVLYCVVWRWVVLCCAGSCDVVLCVVFWLFAVWCNIVLCCVVLCCVVVRGVVVFLVL